MSWSAYGVVVDGNTDALEHTYNLGKEQYPNNYNVDTDEQFEFACSVVNEAFEANVVEGMYSVSCSGHSYPDAENNRKSLAISFSPTELAMADSASPTTEAESEAA